MKKLLFFLTNVFALAVIAQPTLTKAYVVNLKGDTIRGEAQLNPKKPVLIYDKLSFKDLNGIQKNYKPDKIKAFGLDKEVFRSFTYDGEPKFYKVLVSGPLNLYEIVFEVVEGKEVTFESEYFLSYPENKKLVLVKAAKFKKQLADWTKDKPEVAENYPDEKEFDKEKAIAAITEYNSIKGAE